MCKRVTDSSESNLILLGGNEVGESLGSNSVTESDLNSFMSCSTEGLDYTRTIPLTAMKRCWQVHPSAPPFCDVSKQ